MDFKNTKISVRRPLNDYSKIQFLWSLIVRNRKIQIQKKCFRNKKYLNMGCGPNVNSKFINLDYHWRPGVEVCWDVRKKLPFPDGYFDGIYSEHMLEHLPIAEGKTVLMECKRLLKKGSVLRLVVPDGEIYIDLYNQRRSGKMPKFPYEDESADSTSMMCVNNIFYSHGHQFIYDAETLSKCLSETGFQQIEKVAFKRGRNSDLLIDTENRKVESLYVEAVA